MFQSFQSADVIGELQPAGVMGELQSAGVRPAIRETEKMTEETPKNSEQSPVKQTEQSPVKQTEQPPVKQAELSPSKQTEQSPVKRTEQSLVKKKAKPARFVAKGRDVIFDNKTRLYWFKKDSWQDKGKFFNWHEAVEFADRKNLRKIGGFDDWRLPSIDEISSLFDESCENPGKGGVTLHLDPVFPEGAFKTAWIAGDTSTRRPRFDYSEGKVVSVEEYSFGSVRICRKDKVMRHQAPIRRK